MTGDHKGGASERALGGRAARLPTNHHGGFELREPGSTSGRWSPGGDRHTWGLRGVVRTPKLRARHGTTWSFAENLKTKLRRLKGVR